MEPLYSKRKVENSNELSDRNYEIWLGLQSLSYIKSLINTKNSTKVTPLL